MHNSSDWASFSEEISALIKNRGYSGYFGYQTENHRENKSLVVTRTQPQVVTKNSDWLPHGAGVGPSNVLQNQEVVERVTKVTTVTNTFQQGRTSGDDSRMPAEWHAILAELKRRDPVEWLPADRWSDVITNAENFLARWGRAAEQLGWTALDLFGVHPIVPAARFDVMGLIPLIHGGEVVALTETAATIRRRSGALMTYRRCDQSGAVLISEVRS